MPGRKNPQISIKCEQEDVDFKIVDEESTSHDSQIEILSQEPDLIKSTSSQLQFNPNEADEQKRFGRPNIEVDGKKFTKVDIRNLLKENEELKINLGYTRRCCSLLRKQLKDERRKFNALCE